MNPMIFLRRVRKPRLSTSLAYAATLAALSFNCLVFAADPAAAGSDQLSWVRYELQGISVDIPRASMQRIDGPKAEVTPEAKTVLNDVQNAYKNIKSVDISGDFSIRVKTTNESRRMSQPFTSSFEQPNKFRHQMKPDVLVGCDGKSGYVFDEKQNAYLRFNFPGSRQPAQNLPMGLLSTLLLQNPSLLFALTDTPVSELLRSFGSVSRLQDADISGTKCPVLQFGTAADPNRVRLFVDPKTHLIRRFVLDLKSGSAPGKGENDAAVTVEYKGVLTPDGFNSEHFAWTPPPGATDVLEAAGAEPRQIPSDPSDNSESGAGSKF